VSISLEGKTRRAGWPTISRWPRSRRWTPDRGSTRSSPPKNPDLRRGRRDRSRQGRHVPELKTPEIYEGRNVDFEKLVADALDKHGLRGPKADPKTPIILQTFGQSSARQLAQIKIGVPVVLLLATTKASRPPSSSRRGRASSRAFGPAKNIIWNNPDFVKWAHAEGMSVTPYTFRRPTRPGRDSGM
jgi:glycerophosphoryl diester phosphodiesterase